MFTIVVNNTNRLEVEIELEDTQEKGKKAGTHKTTKTDGGTFWGCGGEEGGGRGPELLGEVKTLTGIGWHCAVDYVRVNDTVTSHLKCLLHAVTFKAMTRKVNMTCGGLTRDFGLNTVVND